MIALADDWRHLDDAFGFSVSGLALKRHSWSTPSAVRVIARFDPASACWQTTGRLADDEIWGRLRFSSDEPLWSRLEDRRRLGALALADELTLADDGTTLTLARDGEPAAYCGADGLWRAGGGPAFARLLIAPAGWFATELPALLGRRSRLSALAV